MLIEWCGILVGWCRVGWMGCGCGIGDGWGGGGEGCGMDEIHAVVRRAVVRLALLNAARWFVVCVCVGLGVVCVLRVVEQGFGLSFGWGLDGAFGGVFLWVGVVVVVGTVVLGWVTRPDRLEAARVVDDGAGLRESLSTAVSVAGADDAWSLAAVDQARERARVVKVSSAVPARAPAGWPVAVAMCVGVAVVWVVSPWLGKLPWARERLQQAESAASIVQARADVDSSLEAVAEALKKMDEGLGDELFGDDDASRGDDAATIDPDQIRRAAIRQLTDLRDRVEERAMQGDAARRSEALRNQLEMLRDPKPGPMGEMTRMLSQGDFEGAKRALEEALEKMAEGGLSEDALEAAKEQLEDLAEQLSRLAENQRELERALERAGMDPALASNPEALSAAIQKNQNLSESEKQALQQAADAQRAACEACQGMGAAASKLAQAMGQSGSQGSGQQGGQRGMSQGAMQAAQQLADQLSASEMMGQEANAARAALSEINQQLQKLGGQCQGGQCSSMGAMAQQGGGGTGNAGPGNSPWRAGSGSGEGEGGGREMARAEFDTEHLRAQSQQLGGPIIGSTMIEGDSIRGESTAVFRSVAAAAGERAAEAMETNTIPREYHDAVKHYFGSLRRAGGGEGGGSGGGERKAEGGGD